MTPRMVDEAPAHRARRRAEEVGPVLPPQPCAAGPRGVPVIYSIGTLIDARSWSFLFRGGMSARQVFWDGGMSARGNECQASVLARSCQRTVLSEDRVVKGFSPPPRHGSSPTLLVHAVVSPDSKPSAKMN